MLEITIHENWSVSKNFARVSKRPQESEKCCDPKQAKAFGNFTISSKRNHILPTRFKIFKYFLKAENEAAFGLIYPIYQLQWSVSAVNRIE